MTFIIKTLKLKQFNVTHFVINSLADYINPEAIENFLLLRIDITLK